MQASALARVVPASEQEPQPSELPVRVLAQTLGPELELGQQQAFPPPSWQQPEQERLQVQRLPSTRWENLAPPGWRWRACAPSQVQPLWQAQESHHASNRTSQQGRPVRPQCLL